MSDPVRQGLCDWLAAHGLDPTDVAIRNGPDGRLRIEATMYDRDAAGDRYMPRACTGPATTGVEHLDCHAVTYRVAVPLQSAPRGESAA